MSNWMQEEFGPYARFALLAGLFVAVVGRWRATRDVFSLVKLSAVFAMVVVAAGLWVVWSSERGRWMPGLRLARPAGAFLAVLAAATVASTNPNISLVGENGRYDGLIPILVYAAAGLLVVALWWERPLGLRVLAKALAWAAFVEAVLVWLQKTGLEGLRWIDVAGNVAAYPVGTMGNSNFAGASLAIALPLVAYLLATARSHLSRAVYGLQLVVIAVGVWFTQTRGGLLAAVAGLTVVALCFRTRLPRWVRRGAVAGSVVVAVAAVLVVWLPGLGGVRSTLGQVTALRTSSVVERGRFWVDALKVTRDHPLLGTGPETFFEAYPRYRSAAEGASSGLTLTDSPHNIFLGYAANTGLLGLGTYLLLLAAVFRLAARRLRSLEGEERWLLAGLAGMLAAYLAQGFVSIDVPALAVMGWVAIGGIAALADSGVIAGRERLASLAPATPRWLAKRNPAGTRSRRQPSPEPVRRRRADRPEAAPSAQPRRGAGARWAGHALVAAGVAALLAVGLRPLQGDRVAKTVSTFAKGSPAPALQVLYAGYQRAARLMPFDPTYPTLAAGAAFDRARQSKTAADTLHWLDRAVASYQRALALQPGNVVVRARVAHLYTTWSGIDPAQLARAGQEWQHALALDPTNWELHSGYADLLGAQADARPGDAPLRRRQIDEIRLVARMRPHDADPWAQMALAYYDSGDEQRGQSALQTALRIDPDNQPALHLAVATQSEIPGR